MDKILVEVSIGELLDKISILDIKKDKIKDDTKLEHILREYKILKEEYDNKVKNDDKLSKLYTSLKEINSKLWVIEDEKGYVKKMQILATNL